MRTFSLFVCVIAVAACKPSPAGSGQRVDGKPLETRAANAPGQDPAFREQTRAPYRSAGVAYDTHVVASGLPHPWAIEFLPDRSMLVTLKGGRMHIVSPDGELSPPIAGVPRVDSRDQGGLLDVAVDPAFEENQTIFFSYSEPRDGGNGTAVARARLVRGETPRLDDLRVIWRMTPTLDSTMHFGSRIVFRGDGTLFVTTGERSIKEGRKQAQQLDSAFGKVIRIDRDGAAPKDNPFVGRMGALPEIWSIGHRNIQAAALHPETGELWVVDHGPRGGDEINVAEKGKDYGWPTITYGIEYTGGAVGRGITKHPGMEQPIYYWDPVIAPSGLAFYTADLFPAWRGNMFVGALAGQHLARIVLDGRRVVGEERLLVDRARVRDVTVGPEGAIYVITDEENGQILKIVPAERTDTTAQR